MVKPSLFNPIFFGDFHDREHRSRDIQTSPWDGPGSSSILFVLYSIRKNCQHTEFLFNQKVENWTKKPQNRNLAALVLVITL